MSSSCPIDGVVFCDAAPDTNPSRMQIEFFNLAGNVVRTFNNTGTTLTANVYCRDGKWTVISNDRYVEISSVSCAQDGSMGADRGYAIGSAMI
ncbi:hypothetical protein DICVIV_07784 [Dictyocaulus viviparus]|uniref:C6 domain-containing protein n=1 Tax=Dictyocaulus viviparus TaxID=29172 RepID=A0A0D8XNI3_DICVI|nr:hypothetical protein DICVIV_07784 [Dictyocaulus viviparus]